MGRTSDARERIIRAAARLFLAGSYQAVGVGELCAAADVRKGSFYHFFESKADLTIAVIDHHAAAFDAQLAAAGAAGDDPVAELMSFAVAVGRVQAGFEGRFGHVVGCPFGNLAAELSTADDTAREHLAEVFGSWQRRLAAAARRAADRGSLRPGTDPDALARALLGQMQGAILLAKVCRTPATDIEASVTDLVRAHLIPDRLADAR